MRNEASLHGRARSAQYAHIWIRASRLFVLQHFVVFFPLPHVSPSFPLQVRVDGHAPRAALSKITVPDLSADVPTGGR